MKRLKLPYRAPGWKTAPISPTCEHMTGGSLANFRYCGQPTDYAYPAAGGGWQALCAGHGRKMLPNIYTIEAVIQSGEVFEAAPMNETEALIFCSCGRALTEEELCMGLSINDAPACEKCWEQASDHHDEV